jgi:hypothetical protein
MRVLVEKFVHHAYHISSSAIHLISSGLVCIRASGGLTTTVA